MRQTLRTTRLIDWLELGIVLILVLIPFHATLSVWLSSVLGHYTLLRLWKEFLLILLLAGSSYLIYKDKKLFAKIAGSWLHRLIVAYIGLTVILGLIALADHQVNKMALGYALIDNLRFVIFFEVCFVVASRTSRLKKNWQKILLIPAAIVVGFGLLQHFVLSADFLRHLGYSTKTIVPYQSVDQNNLYIRVQSTLRGPNPLGSYLVIIAAAVVTLLTRSRRLRDRLGLVIFGLFSAIVLFFSYSRSGWVGTAAGVAFVGWLGITRRHTRIVVTVAVSLLIIGAGLATIALHNNTRFEDTFLHTSIQTHSPTSSNQNHESGLKNGLRDIYHQPLGRGPGTAGPASVYNNHSPRIAENYFVQIGQEVGLLGLAIFLAIIIIIGRGLWQDRADPLASLLFGSLIGLIIVNLLSHAWSDDTLAYLWWGLAGIALATKDHETTKKTT